MKRFNKKSLFLVISILLMIAIIGGIFFKSAIYQSYLFNHSALAFLMGDTDRSKMLAEKGKQVEHDAQAVHDFHLYTIYQNPSMLYHAFHKHPGSFYYLMEYTDQFVSDREWHKARSFFYSVRWARYLSGQGRAIANQRDDDMAFRGLFYLLFARKISQDPRISHDLGSVLAFRHQSLHKAEYLLRDALEKDQRNPIYYRTLGRFYAQHYPLLAVSFYECARRLEPTHYSTYIAIGRIFFNEKKIAQAHEWFDRAKKLDPMQETAYFEKARIFMADEQMDKAQSEYRSIVMLNPGAWRPRYQWGIFLFRQQDFEQAITQFTLTLTFNPDYFWAYYYRASSYFQQKEYSKAMLDIEKALSINPDNASAERLYQRINNEIKSS